MSQLTRREVLKSAAAVAAVSLLPDMAAGAQQAASRSSKTVCFYQFDQFAIDSLTQPNGLPTGSAFNYVFVNSSPGVRASTELGAMVRSAGDSFKYAHAFDLHNYPGWQQADDEQLRRWADEFAKLAAASQATYFAFNDLPAEAAKDAGVRARAGKLLKYLQETGQASKLRGLLFLTERSSDPAEWSQSDDEFWTSVDQTCDLVVAEHYHTLEFVMNASVESFSEHLFALPRRLKKLAANKYVALHSSYYGLDPAGWGGVQSDRHKADDLTNYFDRLIAATRASEFGRYTIGFGPLASATLDPAMLPALRDSLVRDLRD